MRRTVPRAVQRQFPSQNSTAQEPGKEQGSRPHLPPADLLPVLMEGRQVLERGWDHRHHVELHVLVHPDQFRLVLWLVQVLVAVAGVLHWVGRAVGAPFGRQAGQVALAMVNGWTDNFPFGESGQ